MYMNQWKDQKIERIRKKLEAEAAYLAGEFARAASNEREAILAEMEFDQWMVDTCDICLDQR